MPLPTTKVELLQNLRQAYEKLDSELEEVSSTLEREKGIEGELSCCDVIAYQIGWANLLMGWDAQEREGKRPEMPSPDFKWNQLGPLAHSFYEREAEKSLDQLRAEFCDVYTALRCWVESLSERELFLPHQRGWTGEKWPMVKWIQVNTIAPFRSARTKIRRWKKHMGM